MQKSVLAMVLAGGKGSRLFPLTKSRAKPAVPFGGKYRIIDFALSNLVNSGIYSVYVLTQFLSQSLTEHLLAGWSNAGVLTSHFVIPVPAQQRSGEVWYRGTADAIYQNLNLIKDARPHIVCIFGGDHIYRMDVSQMIQWHETKMADCTVAAIRVPIAEASGFGVIEIDEDHRIIGFEEKPENPRAIPGDPDHSLASMGNYIFSGRSLVNVLMDDADDPNSSHDFGKDIIPGRLSDQRIYCYDFATNRVPGHNGPNTYWRDVGTIEAFYDANMDLREIVPDFNLYNRAWPIRSRRRDDPPAKFVHDIDNRTGQATNSIVCPGAILSGCNVRNSVIGRNVKIHSFAEVSDSIIFGNVEIGRGAQVNRAIIDKNVRVAEGSSLGVEPDDDARHHFTSKEGIVVVEKAPALETEIGTISI